MYTLYLDKVTTFNCDVQIEGTTLARATVRLMLEHQRVNLFFNGTLDAYKGTCTVKIKPLKGLLDEGDYGMMKLEIIADDTYFVPWTSDFQVRSMVNIGVKNVSTDTEDTYKPEVSVGKVKIANLMKQYGLK